MRKIINFSLFLIILIANTILPTHIFAESKNILILNSYHQTLAWTDSLVDNIIRKLHDVNYFIEYMDTKRFQRDKMFKIFKNYIKYKYCNLKLDLIIVTDNNALMFVVSNKNELFKNIPVLFCGINNFSKRLLKDHNDITGVVEDVDIKGTINAILKIEPEVKNIIALMGANFTSQIYFYKVVRLQYEYRDKVNIIIFNGLFFSKDDYTNELRNIPPNSVILYLNLFKLRDGTIFSIKDSINYIFKNSRKPIYVMWDVMMNFPGVIGGKITSSRLQALYVVNYAKKILYENIPVESLPVITKSPSEYIFDYNELKKFNINFANLPKPYKLINKPPKILQKLEKKEKVLFYLEIFLLILGVLILVLIYNIRKRKIVEEELESDNLQFLTLLNGTNDLIILMSPEGKWVYANKKAVEFFNIQNFDYKGKTAEEILKFTPFKNDILAKYVKDEVVWEKGKPKRYELKLNKNAGEVIYIDVIKIPVFNKDGSRRCIIVSGRDITDFKKMQENLIISQKMDIVGKLAGGIAHDFNNILTVITTNAELCSLLIKESRLKKYIKNIVSASEKASNLIRHLLALGKQDMGSKDIIEVNNSIESIIKILKPSIPENIKFIYEPYYESININADIVQIEQIITNLVFNAKDSVIEKDGKEKIIRVSIEKVFIDNNFLKNEKKDLEEGEYALISVEDSGTGIDQKIIDKIFDPFFTTKKGNKGTGIGLTTVFNLVESNNGFLKVESQKNKGSIFKIYFPSVIRKDFPKLEMEESHSIKVEKMNYNVLFVEDNIDILNALDKSFINIFKKFIIATNGEDALKKVKGIEETIDILITDIVMPEMDGIELAKRLKSINKELFVIFVSGYDSGKLKGNIGFSYKFLYKPYKFETLLNIITKQFK